ncbi:MAG: sugar phosphate nucleotidyltransferase, partial [Gemmataceae bacterium]
MEFRSVAAAILAGGMGTRFQPVRMDIPKILAPVAGRPFICYQLDQLADAGFEEVILLTGHLAEEVRRELGEVYRGMRLIHCEEKTPLGTGGAIRSALAWVRKRPLLVLNGDSFVEFKPEELFRFHSSRKMAISLVLAKVDDTSRFGRVSLDKEGMVTNFHEKIKNSGPGQINAGVYMIQPFVQESIP